MTVKCSTSTHLIEHHVKLYLVIDTITTLFKQVLIMYKASVTVLYNSLFSKMIKKKNSKYMLGTGCYNTVCCVYCGWYFLKG